MCASFKLTQSNVVFEMVDAGAVIEFYFSFQKDKNTNYCEDNDSLIFLSSMRMMNPNFVVVDELRGSIS